VHVRVVAVAGVVLFWAGTLAAAALVPGYSLRGDYTSSLAGRGSPVALLGITALAVLAGAHLAAAVRAGRAAVPLALAGLAGLGAAVLRTRCPDGPAGCGFGPHAVPADLAQHGHGLSVVAYELATVVAMLVVALGRGPRGLRVGSALAALASVVLLLQTGGVDSGAWQRAWLAVNTSWLVGFVTAGRPAP